MGASTKGAPRGLVVIGGGEHARVVIDAARSLPGAFRVLGFADPGPCEETISRMGVAHLGDDAACIGLAIANVLYVSGLGTTGTGDRRPLILQPYFDAKVEFATVIHASAWVSDSAHLEAGAVVLGGAQVNTGARLGAHAVVNTGAVVEHDVTLGAFVMVAPGAVIGGGATVGEGSYVGLGARVRDHVGLGERVLVGMGAVVTAAVLSDLTVVGVPARPLGKRRTS